MKPRELHGPYTDLTLDGQAIASSDLLVRGKLTLDNGLLWVHGNLIVEGNVNGLGAVFATGNIYVEGHMEVSSPSTWAFGAGGQLHLGKPVVITIGR